MSGLSHLWSTIWSNIQDIIHGRGRGYLVFHRLMDVLELFEPSFAQAIAQLVQEAAAFENRSGEEKRSWVIGQVTTRYPSIGGSQINLAIEAALQLLPEKISKWL